MAFALTERNGGDSPIAEDADQNLAHDDATDLEVFDRSNPGLVADFI